MKKSLILLVCVLYGAVHPTVLLSQVKDPNARLKSVQTLVERSSGAHQIEDSGNPQAITRHEDARRYLRDAQRAVDTGDRDAADSLILLATKSMLEAVRLADQNAVIATKKRDDFDNRLSSVTSLLDAHERVGLEKEQQDSVNELRSIVNSKVAKASQLMDENHVDQGRELLDETYVAVKTAIEHLRGGETLVRSLNFATKEEEYHYELDRNDTHNMLVKVLLEEKMRDPRISKMVKQYMQKAAGLRDQAEQQAHGGNHGEAITTLEASTKEVVRAIRSAGIYIPG